MKPRRENGATFVSPMTSDVRMGSALMIGSPGACGDSEIRLIRMASPRTSERVSGAEPRWKSWISRDFLKPNLARKVDAAAPYVRAAFSKQLLRNANHQPARMRLTSRQLV